MCRFRLVHAQAARTGNIVQTPQGSAGCPPAGQRTPYTEAECQTFQALADICGQADAPPLPRDALQRAARWLFSALEARCEARATPAAGAAAARQFCALLRALAAVLAEARSNDGLSLGSLLGCLAKFWTYGVSACGASGAAWPSGSVPSRQCGATFAEREPRSRWSSDSEASDSEGAGVGAGGRTAAARARLAALSCMQALARADCKALHAHWAALLPVATPLAGRAQGATLMDAAARDPSPRVRASAAAVIQTLLEGPPQRAFLAIAEVQAQARHVVRGFTTLSGTLGRLAVALHAGLLQALAAEEDPGVRVAMLRALGALVAAAPYPRLPPDLLLGVIEQLLELASALVMAAPSGCALDCGEERCVALSVRLLGEALGAWGGCDAGGTLEAVLPAARAHRSAVVRAAAHAAPSAASAAALLALPQALRHSAWAATAAAVASDPEPAVRAAAAKTIGCLAALPLALELPGLTETLAGAARDAAQSVRVQAAWGLANLADVLRQAAAAAEVGPGSPRPGDVGVPPAAASLPALCVAALAAARDGDKCLADALADGGTKVQWNACYAAGSLLRNAPTAAAAAACEEGGSERCLGMEQRPGSGLLHGLLLQLLAILRTSANYKICTHAAAALAAVQDRAQLGGAYAVALDVAASALEAAQGGAFGQMPLVGSPAASSAPAGSRGGAEPDQAAWSGDAPDQAPPTDLRGQGQLVACN
ncbi:hypothetical protein WJX81_007459 [Elliptochloris bilobata]|uniref:DUF4042 domain-containing protein n=1 Tax=Elliptochloris bilobata TaxID=381761 RepID=A0AAW1S8C6_9CHLO